MPKATKHPAAKSPEVTAGTPEPVDPKVGSLAVYERFLPLAQALPEFAIKPMREDPAICYQNVAQGVSAVMKREFEVKKLPLSIPLDALKELPDLALALGFAAGQVNRRSTGEVQALRKEASQLRKLLLSAAQMLVLSGDLSSREVEQIKRGKGPMDTAQDCVALAALFKRHEAARKKTPVGPTEMAKAVEVGTKLLSMLRPEGARKPSRGASQAAGSVAIRDRMWTLLLMRHRELRRVGMWLFLDDVNEHVPALRSRARLPRTKKPPEDK